MRSKLNATAFSRLDVCNLSWMTNRIFSIPLKISLHLRGCPFLRRHLPHIPFPPASMKVIWQVVEYELTRYRRILRRGLALMTIRAGRLLWRTCFRYPHRKLRSLITCLLLHHNHRPLLRVSRGRLGGCYVAAKNLQTFLLLPPKHLPAISTSDRLRTFSHSRNRPCLSMRQPSS